MAARNITFLEYTPVMKEPPLSGGRGIFSQGGGTPSESTRTKTMEPTGL